MLAAGTNLRATANWVPGRVRPLDFGIGAHLSGPPKITSVANALEYIHFLATRDKFGNLAAVFITFAGVGLGKRLETLETLEQGLISLINRTQAISVHSTGNGEAPALAL